jgi:hypothetical protein
MGIHNLFTTNANDTSATNARALAGTARLTEHADSIMAAVQKALEDSKVGDELPAELSAKVAASMKNHDEMDALIAFLNPLEGTNVEYLKELGDAELDKMLKSQQSKRSRAKGKQMTFDNYRSMMEGAIGETGLKCPPAHAIALGQRARPP